MQGWSLRLVHRVRRPFSGKNGEVKPGVRALVYIIIIIVFLNHGTHAITHCVTALVGKKSNNARHRSVVIFA